jgi:hypothetical protein
MAVTINAQATNGLLTTADGSGIVKLQSNGVATNFLGWVKFAGATGVTQSSYNVSSVTYNTTGAYYVTWNIALADNNHCALATSSKTDGTASYNNASGWLLWAGVPNTTTSICYLTTWYPSTPWLQNATYLHAAVVGN